MLSLLETPGRAVSYSRAPETEPSVATGVAARHLASVVGGRRAGRVIACVAGARRAVVRRRGAAALAPVVGRGIVAPAPGATTRVVTGGLGVVCGPTVLTHQRLVAGPVTVVQAGVGRRGL